MLTFTLFAVLLNVAFGTDVLERSTDVFVDWKRQFGKKYKSEAAEEAARNQFLRVDAFIRSHNERSHSFTVAHNEWSDIRAEDRKFGLHPPFRSPPRNSTKAKRPVGVGLTTTTLIDWVAKGAVGPVQNQGGHAFSCTGSFLLTQQCSAKKTLPTARTCR